MGKFLIRHTCHQIEKGRGLRIISNPESGKIILLGLGTVSDWNWTKCGFVSQKLLELKTSVKWAPPKTLRAAKNKSEFSTIDKHCNKLVFISQIVKVHPPSVGIVYISIYTISCIPPLYFTLHARRALQEFFWKYRDKLINTVTQKTTDLHITRSTNLMDSTYKISVFGSFKPQSI